MRSAVVVLGASADIGGVAGPVAAAGALPGGGNSDAATVMLVARGHRVSYAVPESFVQIVASAGATPVVYRSVLPDEEAGQRWPDGGVEAMSIFLDEAEQDLRRALAGRPAAPR